MLTSSTQLQNRSFHVVERTRTSSKCHKVKNAKRAKRAKILFSVFKYANCRFLWPSSSSLLNLPNMSFRVTNELIPLYWAGKIKSTFES